MKINIKIIYVIFLTILFAGCATIVAPTGGEQDKMPPKIINSLPANKSINFNSKEIDISFSEFIKTLNQGKLSISPFTDTLPEIKVKRKRLVIKLNNKLKKDITYNIDLSDVVADITENNAVKDLKYVFSTGAYLDSLSYIGRLIDSYTLKPEKDLFVMLYDKYSDSVPYKSKPLYLCKTDEKGFFKFSNIKDNKYKFFALKDENSDYLYNSLKEKVAFIDTLIKPFYINDTAKTDSNKISDLFMFQAKDSIQKLIRIDVVNKRQIGIVFKNPLINPQFEILNNPGNKRLIYEISNDRDSVLLWFIDEMTDSFKLKISDKKYFSDTIDLFIYKQGTQSAARKKSKENFQYKININKQNKIESYQKLIITSLLPLTEYKFDKILVIDKKDTIRHLKISFDSLKRQIIVNNEFKQGIEYTLFIPPNSFTNLLGLSNDSIKRIFSFKSTKDYGEISLNVNFNKAQTPVIICLLNEKDKIIKEKIIHSSGIVKFNNLIPQNYKLKVIIDKNQNNRWDTGNYLRKQQPEKVYIYSKSLIVRPDWLTEIDWKIF
ncbi:MAG: Ig-like domain-containing protein [Bacteroidales bacterium]|nr:Ig-like domain-containing protein [Bacteroidales bacterium]